MVGLGFGGFMKPTAADIAIVIGKIEAGDWLDPYEEPISWSCVLYDPEGERIGDGDAHSAREAMALAWVHAHAPDALIINHVAPGEVPYDVPDGWRFELRPPWQRIPVSLKCSQ
jgi:hypothetical protein